MSTSAATTPPATIHSYIDPSGIAGLTIGEYTYLLALVLAAGADLTAFDQVVSILMKNLGETFIWIAVVGFTATALTLVHFIGALMRDQRAGVEPPHRRALQMLFWPWLLLGATAFAVRLLVATTSAPNSTAATIMGDHLSGGASAFMFFILYVASGVLTAFGAYLTRNPYRTRFRKASRTYRRSLRRLKRSQSPYERALTVLQIHMRGRRRDDDNFEAARDLRQAWGEELKRYAGVLIAAHLGDPSATDGMTEPDWRRQSAPNTGNSVPPDSK